MESFFFFSSCRRISSAPYCFSASGLSNAAHSDMPTAAIGDKDPLSRRIAGLTLLLTPPVDALRT